MQRKITLPTHYRRVGHTSLGLGLTLISGFALADDTVNLSQMVVTASGYEQEVTDAPASITVITKEELQKRSFKDLTDALTDVPGVMVTGGGSSADISMRGMGGKYTLILVDGRRQGSRETRPNSDGPGIEQGWIPPISAIERIEVIRGPMSSLYGSDALGGVINIITRKVNKEWHGEISAETVLQENDDSGDERRTNFYASGPMIQDTLGLEVYGQYSERDEDHITDGFADQQIGSYTAKLTWKLSDDQDIKFEAGHSEQERNRKQGRSTTGTDSNTEYERDNYSITHTLKDGLNEHATYLTHEEVDNPSRSMNYEDSVLNHKSVLNFDNHILTVGAQYEYQKLMDDGNQASDINKLTRWQAAIFAEDEYFLTDDLSVTTGLRFNKDENYGSQFTPRIYGNWHIDDNWTLKGGLSSGYRSPDLRQSSPGWGQITGGRNAAVPAVILGNPDLDPEKSLSRELGIVWENGAGTQLSATAYLTTYKDMISEQRICDTDAGDPSCVYDGTNYRFISERTNIDEAEMRGIEATASFPMGDNWDLSANYTFTDSEQKSGTFKGEPVNRLPRHRFNTTVNWDPKDSLNVWGRMNYYGESSRGQSRNSMLGTVPSYTFVDVGLRYNLTEDTTFYTGIYNLFDKQVDDDTYDKVMDGRRYQAKISMKF